MYQDSLAFDSGVVVAETVARPLRTSSTAFVDSEYGRLLSVLLADPSYLSIVPCNSVSEEAVRAGRQCSPDRALRQHRSLIAALKAEDVRVEKLPPQPCLPDLAFTRDTSLMTPWGLLGLRPGAGHRRAEVDTALASARSTGLPILGRVDRGRIEGGDVAMIRPGLLMIGISGNRTDEDGADWLAALYERHGWKVIRHRFDPRYLHLDTLFCMVDSDLALACTDVLEADFRARLRDLGIELIPVPYTAARRLGCNLLSLGDRRVITAGTCASADQALASRGYKVIQVELDEFLQCGGGVHCLTMPLDRAPA